MGMDSRKRQQKVERRAKKAAKRKQTERVMRRGDGTPRGYADAPIVHCVISREIWRTGVGMLLVSREVARGQIAFGSFLIDIYCLGVKDAMHNVTPRPRYQREVYDGFSRSSALEPIEPSAALKLVQGAIDFAEQFGITPHPDYYKASRIFDGIDASECTREFQFGLDGQPFFVPGPTDNPERCREIQRRLAHHGQCQVDGRAVDARLKLLLAQ